MDNLSPEVLREELAELRAFHAQARTQRVRQLLQDEIGATTRQLESLESNKTDEHEETKGEPQQSASAASSSSSKAQLMYQAITKFGWGQSDKFVSVYVSEDMTSVGSLPSEQISCEFGDDWFDLKVHGLNGKNYRLRQTDLGKTIVPAKSKYIVKPDKVVVMLGKKESWDHWMKLVNTRRKKQASKSKDQDPSMAIMDLMRDMYEDGDPTMKKTIAEAWMKSQQSRGMPNLDSEMEL